MVLGSLFNPVEFKIITSSNLIIFSKQGNTTKNTSKIKYKYLPSSGTVFFLSLYEEKEILTYIDIRLCLKKKLASSDCAFGL